MDDDKLKRDLFWASIERLGQKGCKAAEALAANIRESPSMAKSAPENTAEARFTTANNARDEIYAHTPCGYCVSGINGGWNKCECINYSEFEGRKLSPVA